ncbi:HAMP domain-containing sensor histidine kinase [Clostridiisalibacter paucivorans]|uniref:HAMP domain-containing sensor histidine kinase n=1 Tax=Clostridiisalibacter paucivorans TaxID=408753 RepID=UPI000478B774|nr:histidine kinase dimerization/phospho-acceptor domain-containing protein [Clostridiisalibacter paucivorans]
MDTKLKNYSHSIITKIIVCIIIVVCFTGMITTVFNTSEVIRNDFSVIFENNYYDSRSYMWQSSDIVRDLTQLIKRYKSKEDVLNGNTIIEDEMSREKENLFSDFRYDSNKYNPNLSYDENYKVFEEAYANKISEKKDELINDHLKEYNRILQTLKRYEGLIYYASNGINTFTNVLKTEKDFFKSNPSYIIFDEFEESTHPKEFRDNRQYYWISSEMDRLDKRSDILYIGFTEEFLNPRIKKWQEEKVMVTNSLYKIMGFGVIFLLAFIYLVIIIGRKSFKDDEIHLSLIDGLYNDLNLGICILLTVIWAIMMEFIMHNNAYQMYKYIFLVTLLISGIGFVLVISLIKHIKNKTIIKHTLLFIIFYRLYRFTKDVYNSGSVGVKIVLIVIGYPILVALTIFMFPITIGVAAWLALKKVREFNEIKEGVEEIKYGNIHHTINVSGNGEFGKLASNINSITDGLNKAVENELKSERLKTELITNVSHDIRTPLTSIITYVDLLKKEKDKSNAKKYIQIIDQKSQRLKILTDDLFEASKASSGNIPTNYEKIDIGYLISQGLGELNDKIEASQLKFKIKYPEKKLYVKADGRLLWRAIENLLSNIFKYSLEGSRVYIDIEDLQDQVSIVFKNISAYELNIPSDELMQRFKRGDESRSSEGSGLGLSIANSLINMQNGKFHIEIDGDLFKVTIQIPKYREK